ncbi:MAG TPA: alanine:cation symporter family protein [Nitrospinae bacterium]|nr:alanine:cation symporter family protein [Nitrospinota bacterium]
MTENYLESLASYLWAMPLVLFIVGSGIYFVFSSRMVPYRFISHTFSILKGDWDNPNHRGYLPHFQALSTALSGTLGLGNVAGVAIAIKMGGPGAIFWMWVTALVGTATKFYTASLAVMYRGKNNLGETQAGPMYVILEGLGQSWRPLAVLFCSAGLVGTLPAFQANQLVQIVREAIAIPFGWTTTAHHFFFDLILGTIIAFLIYSVIVGDIKRVGAVAARMVPGMVLLYLGMTVYLLAINPNSITGSFWLIFNDAFSGDSVAGGTLGAVIIMGVRRGTFSNEAGIGTESMAHGAAKTDEPIREGLVAMLGPIIDTLLVCTCTALAILSTGVFLTTDSDGVSLTAMAFASVMPNAGLYLFTIVVTFLSMSTIISYWYYGSVCWSFLMSAENKEYFTYIYIALIPIGAVASLNLVLSLVDSMFALMAIPTTLSALLLSPKVNRAAREYFRKINGNAKQDFVREEVP